MTRQSSTKRSYRRRPGLIQAASELGVSYGHLRMCVAGVRQSRKLISNYRAWQADQRAAKRLIARAAVEIPKLNRALQ
jgi:hypothetical protein